MGVWSSIFACDFQYRPPENEWPTGFNGDGELAAAVAPADLPFLCA